MKMTLKAAIILAVLLAFQGFADAQTSATPPPAVTVPDLAPDQIQPWIAKSNGYVKLLNGSLRAIDSLQRYSSWVDMKMGPTGKERYISYGLYWVDPGLAKAAIDDARAAADKPPAIPELDAAARDCATAFETLVPILNEASAYYQRQDYKDDQMAGGKALHAKIVPAMNTFLAARDRLEAGQEALSTALDKQELALIEKKEGKSERWHIRNLGMAAKVAINAVPSDQTPEEIAVFSTAISAYAEAVRGYDDFNKTSGKPDQTNPRYFLAGLRQLREKVEKKQTTPTDFQNIVSQYNSVVEVINNYYKYQ